MLADLFTGHDPQERDASEDKSTSPMSSTRWAARRRLAMAQQAGAAPQRAGALQRIDEGQRVRPSDVPGGHGTWPCHGRQHACRRYQRPRILVPRATTMAAVTIVPTNVRGVKSGVVMGQRKAPAAPIMAPAPDGGGSTPRDGIPGPPNARHRSLDRSQQLIVRHTGLLRKDVQVDDIALRTEMPFAEQILRQLPTLHQPIVERRRDGDGGGARANAPPASAGPNSGPCPGSSMAPLAPLPSPVV